MAKSQDNFVEKVSDFLEKRLKAKGLWLGNIRDNEENMESDVGSIEKVMNELYYIIGAMAYDEEDSEEFNVQMAREIEDRLGRTINALTNARAAIAGHTEKIFITSIPKLMDDIIKLFDPKEIGASGGNLVTLAHQIERHYLTIFGPEKPKPSLP